MTLTPGFPTAKHLLAKLVREAALLDQEVTSDRFFNFVITGWSLVDWIANDPTVPASAKTNAELDALRRNQWIKICGDIANSGKHYALTQRVPIVDGATARTGYGRGRWGKGKFGIGEECIEIVLKDTTVIPGLHFVSQVVNEWNAYFSKHGF